MSSKGGRRKVSVIQANKITGYINVSRTISQTVALQIVNELVCICVRPAVYIAKAVVNELVDRIEFESGIHSGANVNKKTIESWQSKYPWIVIENAGKDMTLACSTCRSEQKALKLSNVFAHTGTPNIQMSSITRHNSSIEHKNACASAENKQSDCRDQEDNRALGDPDISEEDRVVFNTVYHTAKEQEPSEKVNRHLELQRKNGLDTKYQNISPKTVTEMQEAICNVLTENLVSNINNSPVYSIMLDESTDITVEKKLSICVRYVNKMGKAETTFLCNVPLADGCAHTIVSTVSEQFESLGIDLSKCTSLATDGAAVMIGKRSGVGVQMQSKYSPFCIQTHCIAHRLNLACTDTIKKDEYMVKFRDKFDALYHFITASHSHVSTLKRIQELLDEPELTIKQPHSIRWLGLKNAVEAVYETYASVLATLSKFAAEKKSVAKGLYKYFGNYKVALVIAFMLDIHTELGVLSQQFQKQNLLFSEVQPLIDGTLAKLELMSSVDGEGLRNMKSEINIADDEVSYKGEKLQHSNSMDTEFERLRVAYIKNLRKNIKLRLRKEDGDILADFGKVLEPITVCNTEDQDSNDSLRHLANFYGTEKETTIVYGNLIEGTEESKREIAPLLNQDGLIKEWPRLKGMIRGTYSNLDVDQLCQKIIVVHKTVMPNASVLASIGLCMQLTSVECERSFSVQNHLKSKFRASLQSEKLDCLLKINILGPPLVAYSPDVAIRHWLKKKDRRKKRLFSGYKQRKTDQSAAKRQKVC